MLAFRHIESGAVVLTDDAEGHGAPDWEQLPDTPAGDGPWEWGGSAWNRDFAPGLAALRAERDARLLACDWSQLADVPEATREAWQPYRQALRDITATADPYAPDWPSPPEI